MKMIITILLLMFTLKVTAPAAHVGFVERVDAIQPYQYLIDAVVQVESKGNRYAFNLVELAYGCFQVRECRLKDYNLKTGSKYVLSDMYDYNTAKKVFLFYASQFDYRDVKGICVSWNGKSKDNLYYKKVQSQLL